MVAFTPHHPLWKAALWSPSKDEPGIVTANVALFE
jgi:hypothetical protein